MNDDQGDVIKQSNDRKVIVQVEAFRSKNVTVINLPKTNLHLQKPESVLCCDQPWLVFRLLTIRLDLSQREGPGVVVVNDSVLLL